MSVFTIRSDWCVISGTFNNSSQANTPLKYLFVYWFNDSIVYISCESIMNYRTLTFLAASIDKHEGNLAYNITVTVSSKGSVNYNSNRV